jgi:adenylyl cyclase-associated protein
MADVIQKLSEVVARLEKVASRLEGGGTSDEKVAREVSEYNDYYQNFIVPFVATCNHFDGLKAMGDATQSSFSFLRVVIEAQSKCKKPSDADLMKFVDPIVKVVNEAQKTDNRSPFFNHQKAYAETIQLMNWIFLPGPAAHVSSTLEASEFYLNKVLTQAKDAGDADKKAHRDFVAQIKALITNLATFVQQNFKMGLNWNPKGVTLAEHQAGASSAPAASAGGIPPPPPVDPNLVLDIPAPPPVDPNLVLNTDSAPAPAPAAPGGMAAVFAQIQNSSTSGLKKVTADMKTKNMKDVPVLESKSTGGGSSSAPKPAAPVKKPPALELRQGTWFCENYEENVEIEGQMKNNVYILNCKNCVVSINGKVKSVQVDSCQKAQVVFSSVVSTFEVVNSKGLKIHVQESCPSLAIDKSAGVQVFLNAASVATPPNIITSNTTEINLCIPGKTETDDPIEIPLPEQYQTVLVNGKLVTEPVHHGG